MNRIHEVGDTLAIDLRSIVIVGNIKNYNRSDRHFFEILYNAVDKIKAIEMSGSYAEALECRTNLIKAWSDINEI